MRLLRVRTISFLGVCMCKADYHVVGERCERTKRTYAHPGKKSTEAEPKKKGEKSKKAGHTATAKPGQTCMDGEACTGGSICKDAYCVCADDEVIVEDKCVNSDGQALQVGRAYTTGGGAGGSAILQYFSVWRKLDW